MKVFIVDDSTEICERVLALISELNDIQMVGQAKTLREARKMIQLLKPQAIILDIKLPDGNGIQMLKEIKSNSPMPKIVVFSNHTHPNFRKRCLEAGADSFFDKSTEFEKIPLVLSKWAQELSIASQGKKDS